MNVLSPQCRKQLERTIADARDIAEQGGRNAIEALAVCDRAAYEHRHGMLFACFLAENNLLVEPEMGVAVTLDECEELASSTRTSETAIPSHGLARD